MKQETINAVLNKSIQNSEEEKIKRLKSSFDLDKLMGKYYPNCNSLQSKTAKERIEEISDEVIEKEIDAYNRIRLFWKYPSWQFRGLETFKTKLLEKSKKLLTPLSIEDLLNMHNKLFGDRMLDDYGWIVDFFEDFIIKAVEKDERKTSFKFLLDVWKRTFKWLNGCVTIANMMPEALKNEDNIQQLIKYDEETFNGWNHKKHEAHRFIWQRIEELVLEKYVLTENEKLLSWYLRVTNLKSTAELIIAKLSTIADKKLKTFNTIDEAIDYEDFFEFPNHGKYRLGAPLRNTFEKEMNRIVEDTLKNIKKADEITSYAETISSRYTRCSYSETKTLIVKHWIKLAKVYFNTNQEITIAYDWFDICYKLKDQDYLEYSYSSQLVSAWSKILGELIPSSSDKDLKTLVTIYENAWLDSIKSNTGQKISELIQGLKKPNEFFINCLKNNNYFDNKELFIKKAKEFTAKNVEPASI